MAKPLMIDLYAGLGGWAEGGLSEGYCCIGFDIERHDYGTGGYPAQLVLQDVLTLHGRQFKDADLIVASPPCQFFSYTAMPWSRAKSLAAEVRADHARLAKETSLFDACFRIQREAIEAAGHFIPLVVENVRGAQRWVGRARWNFGSFYLWGDVPALMPMATHAARAIKNPGFRFDGSWRSMQSESVDRHIKNNGGSWCGDYSAMKERMEADGRKQGGDWFNAAHPSISRLTGSKSTARKAASIAIAKIPLRLARHIARIWRCGHDRPG